MGVGGHGRVGVGRVRRGGILRHDVRQAVGGGVGGRGGGGGGGGEVEVERGGGSGRGGGRCRSRDPLQDDVGVKLRLGAVEPGHGGLQQTLLTPVWWTRERERARLSAISSKLELGWRHSTFSFIVNKPMKGPKLTIRLPIRSQVYSFVENSASVGDYFQRWINAHLMCCMSMNFKFAQKGIQRVEMCSV